MPNPKSSFPPEFEFCEVCNVNHNAGRKHKYTRSHSNALSALLKRFERKIDRVWRAIKDPELGGGDGFRFWCVFCGSDVGGPDGGVECSGAIYHLASKEHVRNLKDFMSKHGGGMDKVDSFMVSDDNLVKWEKKCDALKSVAQSTSRSFNGSLQASLKDIHYESSCSNINNLDNTSVHSLRPIVSHDVMPLQSSTNEGQLQSRPEFARIPGDAYNSSVDSFLFGSGPRESGSSSACASGSINEFPRGNPGYKPLLEKSQMMACYSNSDMVNTICPGKEGINGSHAPQHKKFQKLNPKRVGAAWAEKRRIELEMEKRGEIVLIYDPNWLPNFGGAWQAGTRKESRKEFDLVKRKTVKQESQVDTSVQIQPYISKRMKLSQSGGGSSSIDSGAA